MSHEAFFSEGAPNPAGPYSHAIRAGDFVFVSGQGPHAKERGQMAAGFEDQARQVFKNIRLVLESAGSSLEDVVKVSVYLADLANFKTMNDVYREVFKEPYPVRTTVQAGLLGGIGIEVDVIAHRPR